MPHAQRTRAHQKVSGIALHTHQAAAVTSSSALPKHWTPEQALAVRECTQALREQLWAR